MLAFTITTALILLGSNLFQDPAMSEKRAVASAQEVLASELDAELPSDPFAKWFRQMVGPDAGITWQLNECGDQPSMYLGQGRDLPACAEVDALLPDGRKVVVMIEVGTFNKGITGIPSFAHAAIEQQGELFRVRRLRDLPEEVRAPGSLANENSIKLMPLATRFLELAPGTPGDKALNNDGKDESAPPPPPKLAATPSLPKMQNVSEGVLLGNVLTKVLTKVQPLYPLSAKKVNASGKVEVQVTISVDGHIIEAVAISGHPLLRPAALDAARRWVFKPTILNNVPVQVQSVLTFVFASPP
jgi:TonB family protein